VVDRQPGPALETSFANAGEVSPGYSAPLGRPGRAAQGHQVDADAPQPAGHQADARPGHVALGREMLRNCTEARYRVNKSRMVRLAEYSRDCLKALRADTGIAYDERTRARCSCSAPRSSWTARPRTSRS
jgi:D-amino-acid dehydrogenase